MLLYVLIVCACGFSFYEVNLIKCCDFCTHSVMYVAITASIINFT